MVKGVYIIGFETYIQDGTGSNFNFIMSNGARSNQRDKGEQTKYAKMMPEGADKRIRRVDIYSYSNKYVLGFAFFDKDHELIWRIGFRG